MTTMNRLTLWAGVLAAGLALAVAGCNTDGLRASVGSLGGGGGGNPDRFQQAMGLFNAGNRFLTAASLSEKDEDAIGQAVAVGLTNQSPPVSNQNLQRYVNLVGLTVASASPNPGGNWVFGVLETPEVNAFSGPNGYVFVTHGALLRMHDEAELAGVLAHEIAHVCNHDGLTQIKNNETKGAMTDAMRAADSRTAALAVYADNGLDVVTRQGYDQKEELAADGAAVHTMAAAGYNPYSYLNFLTRLRQEGAAAGGGKLMSTHPGINDRIARVSQELAGLPNNGATLADRFTNNAINLH